MYNHHRSKHHLIIQKPAGKRKLPTTSSNLGYDQLLVVYRDKSCTIFRYTQQNDA